MSEERIAEARQKAGNNFREGYNCAESIFLAFRELLDPEIDPRMLKIFTAFGGGIGESGCVCGALTGSIAALGMLVGRTSVEQDRHPIYELAGGFKERFEEFFGSTCCRNINPYYPDIESKEGLKNCLKVTGNTAKLLMEYLYDRKLLRD